MILNRGSMPPRDWEESDANFPDQNLQRHSGRHSRLHAHWLMALVGGGGWAFPGNLLSLLFMEGVCGWSLTAGKILFTGR